MKWSASIRLEIIMQATARKSLSACAPIMIVAESNPTIPWVTLSNAALITGFIDALSRLSPTTHVTAIARLNNEFTIQLLWTIIAHKSTAKMNIAAIVNKRQLTKCAANASSFSALRKVFPFGRWGLITERLESFKYSLSPCFMSLSRRYFAVTFVWEFLFVGFRMNFWVETGCAVVKFVSRSLRHRQPLALSIFKSSEVFSSASLFEQQRKLITH